MLALFLPLLGACATPSTTDRVEPTFIEVTLGGFSAGSEDAPLPFDSAATQVPLSLRTLDKDGELYPFEGDLVAKVRPGAVDGDGVVHVTGGEWSGEVGIRNAFGPTRIWLTDEGDDTRQGSFSVGVSDTLWYAEPTIRDFQTTDDTETNQLAGEFVNVRAEDRQIVVTAVDAAGFWVTDTDDEIGTYNSLYVYTFGKPDDAYVPGARVTLLSGIDQEYLASTQFSNPTLETEGEMLDVPPAVALSTCSDNTMEGLEGARVRIENGTIPDTFTEGTQDYSDYETYGQWPITFGSCTLYVESGSTAPDFFPGDYAGTTLPSVEGMVKQIFSKWIVTVVSADDLVTGEAADARAARHHRRPRPARHDLPSGKIPR